jgi:uncharacterized protein
VGEADNKRIAAELFARLTAGDVEGALSLAGDDLEWRLPGKPELLPTAGVYDKRRLRKLFQRMLAELPGGLQMAVVSAIAEGDRVAVEAVSSGDLRNGRKYRQEYHFLIAFREGKIAAVHEYLDTQHAFDVWIRP